MSKGKTQLIDEDERTNALGLFNFGHSYWQSALALAEAKIRATHPDSPIYFLFYQALALFLKADLRAQGISVADLRSQKFGHDLSRLYEAASGFGIQFDDEYVEILCRLANTGNVLGVRYIYTGSVQRPTHEELDRTCRCVYKSVFTDLKSKGLPVRLYSKS